MISRLIVALLVLLPAVCRGQSVAEKIIAAEAMGEAGATAYARSLGFDPLLLDEMKSIRQGFDQVWTRGDRVLVIEAKGGAGRLGVAYGHAQASEGWTLEVARQTLRRANATQVEIEAARRVLSAARKGNLEVQVVRTNSAGTRVVQTVRFGSEVAVRRCLAALALAAEAYARIAAAVQIEVEYLEGTITAAVREERHGANVFGSVGGLTASVGLVALVTPQGIVATMLTGGAGYVLGDLAGGAMGRWVVRGIHRTGTTVAELIEFGWDWTDRNAPWLNYAARQAKELGEDSWQGLAVAWDTTSKFTASTWSATCSRTSDAWEYTGRKASETWAYAGRKAEQAYDYAAEEADNAYDYAGSKANQARSYLGRNARSAWSYLSRQASRASNAVTGTAKSVRMSP